MDLIPEEHKQRVADDLRDLLVKEDVHLTTGFVGTPYLCHVLSENGYNDLAYTLLLNEDYPSWLFAVNMGATTIWERWNSIKADGLISGTGMNSLNHYAYGSIIDWVYKKVCGINPIEEAAGYKKLVIEPKIDHRLTYAKALVESPKGTVRSEWKIKDDLSTVEFYFEVPFDTEASVILPPAKGDIKINGEKANQEGKEDVSALTFSLSAGSYTIEYKTKYSLKPAYSSEHTMSELLSTKDTREILEEVLPGLFAMASIREMNVHQSIRDFAYTPIVKQFITDEKLDELDKKLEKL